MHECLFVSRPGVTSVYVTHCFGAPRHFHTRVHTRVHTHASVSVSMTVSTTASQTLSLSTPVLFERMTGQWRSLVYREALRMVAALRQIIAQSNGRSPVARSMLTQFNGVLIDIRRPVRADGCEPDLHAQELDFETSLRPWMELFHCHEITGVFVLAGIQSLRAFVHAGLLTDEHSPLSRAFVHDLVFALANVRFEPTVLEHDEIVMLELIDLLAELVEVAVAAIKSDVYSPTRLQNDEVVGETFVFQLLDLLFMLLNQGRFSGRSGGGCVHCVSECLWVRDV